MLLSDVSIRRPTVAIVASLLLVVFGAFALAQLPVRETPNIDQPTVTVRVDYRGASAEVVETKIIQVIEEQISGIEGIKTISSAARDGVGIVTIEFLLERDIDDAANDVREQVARTAARLPPDAEPPIIQKADSEAYPIMVIAVLSSSRSALELSDYVERQLRDPITAADGVALLQPYGYRKPSLRVWLDRRALAARQLTVADIESALRRENVEFGAGKLESEQRDFTLRTSRAYQTPEEFAQLVIARGDNNYLVRLGEVAKVEVAAEDDKSTFRINDTPAVGLGVVKRPGASTLTVVKAVRARVEELSPTLPPDIRIGIWHDSSEYINETMNEVGVALAVAAILVVGIIYLFLGTVRAAIIPAVTVPVSLIGTFIVLWALGYSINILTFLALVLAVGLVVDDAIIVLENIHRRIKEGEPPLLASFRGAQQIGMAVLATTIVLAAVFVPIMLMTGTIGSLFKEFAAAMATSVVFSMFVALTLTPVMCAKILRGDLDEGAMAHRAQAIFERAKTAYRKVLGRALDRPGTVLAGFFVIIAAAVGLFLIVAQEFTPVEDRGAVIFVLRPPQGASVGYTNRQAVSTFQQLKGYLDSGEGKAILQMVNGGGGGSVILHLKPWSHRDRTSMSMMGEVRAKVGEVPGAQIIPVLPPTFGSNVMAGTQFVLGGTSYDELRDWRDKLFAAMAANPRLSGMRSDYNETTPQMRIHINRNRAADMGVSSTAIGQTLQIMMGSRKATTYLDRGREYDVIMQSADDERRTPTDISNIYVRSDTTRELVPLSSLITIEEMAGSDALNRFDRMRSITISFNAAPGYALGAVVNDVEGMVRQLLPSHARIKWRGEAQEMKESNVRMYLSFGLALVVVFLVLAAQFESFVHPFVIMMTVPLAVAGALAGLVLSGQSLNIYSQIGIIVLIGLAAKNGILIVEFANQLRDEGLKLREAVVEASIIRLRPIVMTALATVMGAVPLVLASGAGAEGRRAIGIVIFVGVSFATLITLLVVPVFYMLLAGKTVSPGHVSAELEEFQKLFPGKKHGVRADGQAAE